MTNTFDKFPGRGSQRSFGRWLFLFIGLFGLMTAVGPVWSDTALRPPQPRAMAETVSSQANPADHAIAFASQGRMQDALTVLLAWQPTAPADLERKLWSEAVLLRQLGRRDDALPRLEALVARRPDVPRFRIALGEVLTEAGQTDRARLHFSEGLAGARSEADRLRAEEGLSALGTDRPLSGYFGFSFVPSTNAAQATSATTFRGPFGLVRINPNSRKRSAMGVQLDGGVSYAPRIGPRSRLRFGLSSTVELFDGKAPDDLRMRAEIALVHDLSQRTQVEAGVTYSARWIDNKPHSKGPGLTFGLTTMPTNRDRLQVFAVAEQLDHDSAPGLDGTRALGVLSYAHALSPQFSVRGLLRLERNDAAQANAAFSAWDVGMGATYLFRGGLRIGMDVTWREAQFDGPSFVFGATRRDEQLSATLRMSHSQINFAGFAPELEVSHTRRNSNIFVYSFDELSARVGLIKQF